MFWRFFRDSSDGPSVIRDRYGEWMLVKGNKELSFVADLLDKSLSKVKAKRGEVYVLQFTKDELVPNLFSIKGMVQFRENVIEANFQEALKKVFDDVGHLGEIKTVRLRLCNELVMFFYFNLVLKRTKKARAGVKLLLPPLGVSVSGIPYTLGGLFNAMAGSEGREPCIVEADLSDSRLVKVLLACRKFSVDSFRLKEALLYFLEGDDDLRLSRRTGDGGTTELEITLLNFKRDMMIPLLWDNYLSTYSSC
ncbi:hypothetical protein MetMK1DRAFT_00027690 [Metallosphaera yellowstonensis MK1]|jgi:hypothetical protein|uniref:Uncharacterized protein n=1 Tax=Metallosphaera yellowstonensis MK1 TaxID=671065 RepID=H2C865_9CREN|nr:hypothetical protein [Metallosphaera yellowstonensis]EHP68341.1 hypothetical protein MetMK1DRAFT_00027690 [Metallosphaera yellowstonensis MK1]